jgi:hypothetical protein
LIVLIVLLAVGSPFVLLGWSEANQAQQSIGNFVSARGTVVDNSHQTQTIDDKDSAAYFPVIEFKPNDGPQVRFMDGVGALPPDYAIGAQVDVLYNPQEPHQAKINSWKRLWFVPTLLIVIGLAPITIYMLFMSAQVLKRK